MGLGPSEAEEDAKLRFQVELEFVQALANPNYLNCSLLPPPSLHSGITVPRPSFQSWPSGTTSSRRPS